MMVFFTVRPDIDLDASRWFWTDGFRLGEDQFLISVRDLNRALPAILLSGLVCLLLVTPFVSGVRRAIRPHKLLLVLTFYALGPGATVHVLKNLFGRARPRHISEFGADLFFTPVLSLDGSLFAQLLLSIRRKRVRNRPAGVHHLPAGKIPPERHGDLDAVHRALLPKQGRYGRTFSL
nr:hypothetical protein [Rhizobium sp. AN83]